MCFVLWDRIGAARFYVAWVHRHFSCVKLRDRLKINSFHEAKTYKNYRFSSVNGSLIVSLRQTYMKRKLTMRIKGGKRICCFRKRICCFRKRICCFRKRIYFLIKRISNTSGSKFMRFHANIEVLFLLKIIIVEANFHKLKKTINRQSDLQDLHKKNVSCVSTFIFVFIDRKSVV